MAEGRPWHGAGRTPGCTAVSGRIPRRTAASGRTRRIALQWTAAVLAEYTAGRLAATLGTSASALLIARAGRAAALTGKDIALGPFDRLVLAVPAQVLITIADRNHARIEAEQKVIDSIAFKIEGRSLRVFAAGSFETRQPIIIRMACRELSGLEAHASVEATLESLTRDGFSLTAAGSATVTLEKLNLASLVADISGSAIVTAQGKAQSQQVTVGGAGTYDAAKLASVAARIEASGSSDVAIHSRDQLEVEISGAATVKYAGSPKLKRSVDGAGTLERM